MLHRRFTAALGSCWVVRARRRHFGPGSLNMAEAESNFSLSREDLQKFQESGIGGPFRLLEAHEVESLLAKLSIAKAKLFFFDRILSRSLFLTNFFIYTRWGKATWSKGLHLVSPVAYALAKNPMIIDKIESILGPNLLHWGA